MIKKQFDEVKKELEKNKNCYYMEYGKLVLNSDNESVKKYVNLINKANCKGSNIEDLEHNSGIYYCKNDNYVNALGIFEILEAKKYKNINFNIGYCYYKLKKYDKAVEYYKKEHTYNSYGNLLDLYYRKHIEFNEQDFFEIIKRCKKEGIVIGFLYLSYYYQGLIDESHKDYKKAFKALQEGLLIDNNDRVLLYELAYCYEKGVGCKKDYFLSHFILSKIFKYDAPDPYYHYAYQCYNGMGCKKDIELALHYALLAAAFDSENALELLLRIYKEKDDDFLVESVIERLEQLKNKLLSSLVIDAFIYNEYQNEYKDIIKHVDLRDGLIEARDEAPPAIKRIAEKVSSGLCFYYREHNEIS